MARFPQWYTRYMWIDENVIRFRRKTSPYDVSVVAGNGAGVVPLSPKLVLNQ